MKSISIQIIIMSSLLLMNGCALQPEFQDSNQVSIERAIDTINLGSKLGIDATQKTLEEGFEREIQEQVKVDEETKKLVDSKWSSYEI